LRVISKIKSYLRQSPTILVALLSAKRFYFTVTGKRWIIGLDDDLRFLSVPLAKATFNRRAVPWDGHPLSFFGQKPFDF